LRNEFDSSFLQLKNINQQLANQNLSLDDMKSRINKIESSASKYKPEPQIIQVPHECNFNEKSLTDIQTKLLSLTNTVNILKEE
jgi:DNA repair ATPase RecN